jgi:hypothetical protein
MTTTNTKTVELWIDALNAVWALDCGNGQTVRTPKCSTKDDFPESLPDLSDKGPIALSWPVSLVPHYGASGSSIPTILIWKGETELHLCPDVKKTNLAFILKFFGRIINAAKTNSTLGGLVTNFTLLEQDNLALSILQYGSEVPHHGIVIHWEVKQNLSGQI